MKKERLKKYWQSKGYKSAKAFASALGISDSHISEIDQRSDSRKLLLAIRSIPEFNDLDLIWLETGEGEMLKQPQSSADPREQYGVTALHRTLTPEQERALQILDSAPEARRLLERFMLLDDEGERAIIMGEVEKLLYEKRRRNPNQ